MRPKSLLLLALALGCGLIASIGISQVMEKQAGNQAPQIEMEEIYVALEDINVNEPLTEENVKLEKWPAEKIHADAMKNLEAILNRRAGAKIYAGDPIREAKLIPIGGESATQTIPPGYRTVTVRVDASSGTPGLLKPGDRVDVQLFVKANPAIGIEETKTQSILQDVKVFAVDQQYRRSADGEDGVNVARTISLLVTPKQANKVSLASRLGDIFLLPRHPDDKELAQDSGLGTDELFGIEKSDREQESQGFESADTPKSSSVASGIASFLNNLKKNQDDEDPQPATSQVAAANDAGWKIVIVEGTALREVEVYADGRLPREVSESEAGSNGFAAPGAAPGAVGPSSYDAGLPPQEATDFSAGADASDASDASDVSQELNIDLDDLKDLDDDLNFRPQD